MRMKSKSTLPREAKARMEFKGKNAKAAQKADDKSDKAIAKKFGVKRAK